MTQDRRGRRNPTSRDVAALAGVAQSTVSAAMSGKRVVAAETKQRIEQAMVDLGYQPHAGARTLRTSKTNVIALVVALDAQVDSADTIPYIETVVEEAREHEYDVVLSTAAEGPAGLQRLIGRSICDAMVLMDIRRDDERISMAAALDRPTVLMGRPDDAQGLDVVDFDSRRAAELLVDDFAATGHELIVTVATDDTSEQRAIADFYDRVDERAAEHGMTSERLVPVTSWWRDVAALSSRLATHRGTRLGVIARTPRSTDWAQRLIAGSGLVVGVDASLAALCTDDVARSFEVPVSNVSPMPRDVSARAMAVLFRRIDGGDESAVTDLVRPTDLTRRASTVRHDLL